MKKFSVVLLLTGAISTLLGSCLKKDFDRPSNMSEVDPNLPVNMTVDRLKLLFANSVATQRIDSAWRIWGIVTADDRTGNFYKQITIADSTGGIAILINRNNLYTKYPVGRKVYVDLRGLYFGYYARYPLIGMIDPSGAIADIPPTVIDNFITRANFPNSVIPDTVSLADLIKVNVKYLNRLVAIKDVEFHNADLGKTYALDPVTASQSGSDRFIKSCADSVTLNVRTSNYASFSPVKIPAGRGTITGVYTVYYNSPQLLIRDTTDVHFYGKRCDTAAPVGVIFTETFNSSTTGDVNLPGWTNYAEVGAQKWRHSNAGSTSNPYARISAFNTGDTSVVSWLITPPLDLAAVKNAEMTFRTLAGFHNGATLDVLYSTDFNGDPTAANWTPMPALISQNAGSFSGAPWVASGALALPSVDKLYVAFRYKGADPSKTTTYELDDVIVSGQ